VRATGERMMKDARDMTQPTHQPGARCQQTQRREAD